MPFSEGQAWRARRVLQLVHADLCGPMKTASITGNADYIVSGKVSTRVQNLTYR